MYINPVSATLQAGETANRSTELNGDAFLTLLVAQLRSQNPFQPMDPMEFVNQLVQFNLLDQIIRIRLALESEGAGVTPAN